jgi:segregation and condensation protein B
MSKGKKAKPGKKGAAKSSAKPARSKPKASKGGAAVAALADDAVASDAEASEQAEPREDAVATEHEQEGEPAEPAAEGAAEAAGEGAAPVEAAPADKTTADEQAVVDEAAQAPALEAAAESGDDDEVPVEPKGPDTPVAELPRPDQKRLVESLVFVSDRAINAQQLGRMLKIKSALAKELADELITEYAGRGIELVELSGGYQFRSAPSSAHVVREHIAQPPVRLTRAQLETLALVAYRQPITRPEIDDVRGVDSGSALRVLLERGLLKMLGRKDEPGRPLLYGTTPFFLDFFGMRSLKDLPTLREFTELSEENRALFKKKTGETIEEAEAALLAAEEAAQRDSLAAPSDTGEAEPPPSDDGDAAQHAAEGASEGDRAVREGEGQAEAEPTDRDLEVEAETFAAGSLQTSPDSASQDREREDENEGELDEQELPQAPEA